MGGYSAASYSYREVPILDAARRCGLTLNERTLNRDEVEAACPFCGDRGPGKYHLSLNTRKNVYRCNLCNASGNSVSLYARLEGVSFRQAYQALSEAGRFFRFPAQPAPQTPPEREPCALARRHDTYCAMLDHLELSPQHKADLLARGLTEARIARNQYRTLPQGDGPRRLLAGMLADFYDLEGVPGFYTDEQNCWNISGYSGLLVPSRNKDGLIQGLQIRLDGETDAKRKYRWLSSRGRNRGVRSLSWIHVTGNIHAKTAYLTEGGLKGDVASFLDHEALFLCFAGVNAIGRLKDAIRELDLSEAVLVLDMDKLVNAHVREALEKLYALVRGIPGLRVRSMDWNMSFKGIDNFYLARNHAQAKGVDILDLRPNFITRYLDGLWEREHPGEDRGFIHACEWEERTVLMEELECSEPENPEQTGECLRLLLENPSEHTPLVCVNRVVIHGQQRYWAYKRLGYQEVQVYQNVPWALPAAS